MSRIGKAPITLPKGVEIKQSALTLTIKGPKGELSQSFNPAMKIGVEDGMLKVERPSDSRQHRAMHGLTRALINNMVVGVSEGFKKTMLIEGVGYRAEMDGKDLILNVGYSHPVRFVPEKDMQFGVENRGKLVTIAGIDKQVVGETAAKIRKTRPPEPYKGKGIRYNDEIIRRKAGKAGKV